MSHRRASTTSSISSFFDPSREIDSFASPVRGGMVFSEPQTSSSSSRPPISSNSSASAARPPVKTTSTSSLTSSLKNNNNSNAPQPVAVSSAATTASASVTGAGAGGAAANSSPPSSNHSHSRNSSLSGGTHPLAVSIPRQRSISSSFSLATSAGASPRTFTGSSIISNPGSFPGQANPFAGAFAPISPTSSSPPGGSNPLSASVSQSVPILHRRFSSSFNQLNQIVSPSSGVQSNERGRRTSMFGGSSPPTSVSIQTANTDTSMNNSISTNAMGSGLFRKFSTSGRSSGAALGAAVAAGHPFDRNDAGPTVVITPQPSSNQQQHSSQLPPPGQDAGHLTTAVDKLKPSYDKTSRSSSPMRSMILNGQMLD